MLLLKVSYWIAFASAAICAVAAFGLADATLVGSAIGGFIGGSLIAGIDRIVTLLTPEVLISQAAVGQSEMNAPAASVSILDLEARLAKARAGQRRNA